ncbi:Parallel_beta-helix repeat [Hexamita inflata]|uniref:Parallel beta-helix repeat n=1 Tax=Hexamita inflata TaxID=28002 RepID=A0AA86V586_9EUKA|nr:Parallel beta-helix repeat [Hexamita inflata]
MLSSIISLCKSLQSAQFTQQLCANNLQLNNNNYLYCQKQSQLNTVKLQNTMYISQKAGIVNMFIYTNQTQQSTVDIAIDNINVHTFAIFGLNGNNQQVVMDSLINVTLKFEVLRSGLLCIQCDVTIKNSTLVYVASGQQISGLIIQALTSVKVEFSFIQFRISSLNSSGIVNVIDKNITFLVSDTKLSGACMIQSDNNGYISSKALVNITLELSQFTVCVNNISRLGSSGVLIDIIGSETFQCDICGSDYISYGLCVDNLQFGEVHNQILFCVYPFEYVDNKCVCSYGHLLNITKCVNVLEAINKINIGSVNDEIQQLQNQVDNLANLLAVLDESISNNISLVTENIRINTTIVESYIISNFTKSDINLAANSTALDYRIFNNITALNNSLINSASVLNSSINSLNDTIEEQQNKISQLIQLINCTNKIGYQVIDGLCVQTFCQYFGQISVNGICQCLPGYALVDGSCQRSIHTIISQIPSMSCTKNVYVATYDITEITHSITEISNFSSGYAFASTTHISQAYIYVNDNVFPSNSIPLFQSQSTFTNIKVQIESQTVNGGAILSYSNTVVINSVNIVSAPSNQIAVNAGFQLNILQSTSVNAKINNLLVDLSFAMSQGNITLIGSVSGVMNIAGYQILGVYQSSSCMAMITLEMASTTLSVTQLNFMPSEFNSGNCSSFMLSSVSSSTVSFSYVSIILGNETNYLIANQIESINYTTYYQFGGIVCILTNASIMANQIISNSYQVYNSNYSLRCGLFIGFAPYNGGNINIYNVCLQQSITSDYKIQQSGIIGFLNPSTSIQNTNIIQNISCTILQGFGIVGFIAPQNQYCKITNLKSTVHIQSSMNGIVSAVYANLRSLNGSIINATIINSDIQVNYYAGGLIGYLYKIPVSVINSSVKQSKVINTHNCSGGFFGYSVFSNITIINSTIDSNNISAPLYYGILIGGDLGGNIFDFTNSSSIGNNFINNNLISNCANFLNFWSVTQCECPYMFTLINGVCKSIYEIDNQEDEELCSQEIFISIFNVIRVEEWVIDSNNYTSGYVFSNSSTLQNTQIQIVNNIFTSHFVPLFQSQSTFVNMKVQIESQTVNGGAILSYSNTVVINSVNIVSAPSNQIAVNAGFQLNILQSTSVNAKINNLLVDLSFAMSQGNITLIGSVSGVMNIAGYQILGVYQSSSCMAMITLEMASTTLSVTQLNFMPSEFNSGNCSSFMLSSVSSSTVSFNYVSIILGNETNYQIANQIASTTSLQYQFGGLINMPRNSNVTISNTIYDSYQSHQSQYIRGYGLIIGQTQSTLNLLSIQSICISQNIHTIDLQISGLIGQCEGNCSIIKASVSIYIQGTHVSFFGVAVGVQTTQCVYAEVINFRSTLNTFLDFNNLDNIHNDVLSGVFAYHYALNCSVQNSTVQNSNISAQFHTGGFCGFAYITNISILNSSVQNSSVVSSQNYTGGFVGRFYIFNLTLMNSTVNNCNISSQQYSAGGFIGHVYSSKLYISTSTVSNVRISSPNYAGIVVGCDNGLTLSGSNTYSIISSQSIGSNYINGMIKSNCIRFTNTWSQQQC